MAGVTIKLALGTFSVEVTGPRAYAEKKVEELIGKYLTGSVRQSGGESAAASAPVSIARGKKPSPAEFLKRAGVSNQTGRALLLGYYAEKLEGMPGFTTAELRALGTRAKTPFSNISDITARLVGRGMMMSAGE